MAIVPWEFSNVQTISVSELQSKLREVKGCRAVSVVTVTVPQMNKKVTITKIVPDLEKGPFEVKEEVVFSGPNPYHGRVQKRTYRSVMIGFRYANSVNNQLGRQGLSNTFTAEPRKWGVHVTDTPLIEHKDKFYLECKVERVIGNQYYVDGEIVEDSVVEPYITKRTASARQAAVGVEKEIILIDVALENIETIVMNGDTYTIAKEEVPA